jgi:hypothetical protein
MGSEWLYKITVSLWGKSNVCHSSTGSVDMLETPGIPSRTSTSHSALWWPLLLVHDQKFIDSYFILALCVAFYNFVDILRAVWLMSWGFKKFVPASCKITFRIPNFIGLSQSKIHLWQCTGTVDFTAVGENVCRCRIAISRPLYGWREEWERKMWMVIGCGMRLQRMRHEYVKKISMWTYYYYYYHHHHFKIYIYPHSLGTGQQSCNSKSHQQWIKAIYPSTLWMICAVLISVIVCSSMADGWRGSNWNLWTNPFLIVPNDHIITAQFFSSLSTSCCYLSEMGEAFSTHCRNDKCTQNISKKTWKEETTRHS